MLFRRLFWHISYYNVRQKNFITKGDRLLLQSASGITKCDKRLLQSESGITKSVTNFFTKCVRYYKVWQLLQSETKHSEVSRKNNFLSCPNCLLWKRNFYCKKEETDKEGCILILNVCIDDSEYILINLCNAMTEKQQIDLLSKIFVL